MTFDPMGRGIASIQPVWVRMEQYRLWHEWVRVLSIFFIDLRNVKYTLLAKLDLVTSKPSVANTI